MQEKLKIFKTLTVLFGVLVLLCGCGQKQDEGDGLEELNLEEKESAAEKSSDLQEENTADSPETYVYVYVCGEVHSPGVYRLKSDARVFEAVEMAGGMTEEAAGESINQAEPVTDGARIYVPSTAEVLEYGAGGLAGFPENTAENQQGKININTAGKEELMKLTGIGEAKAQSIIDYREEHGRFQSIEELMQIEGIKEGVFNKIKDNITI